MSGCGMIFWYGVMTALVPSFAAMAVLLALTWRRG